MNILIGRKKRHIFSFVIFVYEWLIFIQPCLLPKSGPNVEALIEEIKDVAYNCTKRVECKCPEGYFKTIDGLECLRISREPVDCMDAERVCENDFNSRLAIAKDPKRLRKFLGVPFL